MDEYGVPEIFESEAKGSLKAVYGDIQNVLKVPVVNFIFRTLAWYERFLQIGWDQARPNMLTFYGKKAADTLRYPEINVEVPKIDWLRYYEPHTLERIRSTVLTFNVVNPKLLLIASAWAESLSNRPNRGEQEIKGTVKPGILPDLPPIELVHIPDALPPVRSLLLDIAEKHRGFDGSSDFRALAHYPQFLNLSWQHLREYVGTREYVLFCEKLKVQSIQLTKEMPYAVTINRKTLEAYYSPAEIAGIMGIVSMFQNFLPGLIVEGEFLRRILLPH